MNTFDLSRNWFNFCFDNPEKIKPNHTAVYFFAIEHCNRLGWKEKFGFPTTMVMEAIGIKSYNTYINTLHDIVEFGFIDMIEKSKNQYSANIIALSKFDKALDKALDKAFIKHATKQSESTSESIVSINKQETTEQETSIQEPLKKPAKIKIEPLDKNGFLIDFSKWTNEDLQKNIKLVAEKKTEYTKDMLINFYKYWTAPNKKGIEIFKKERSWSTASRLATWFNNQKK